MAVFEYKIPGMVRYSRNGANFDLPIRPETKDRLLEMWSEYKKGDYYNSECIRLESITTENHVTYIELSKTDFYSLIISNIIVSQISDFSRFVRENYGEKGNDYIQELTYYYSTLKECGDFVELITEGNLPNALATSVMVRDRHDNILLVKRTSNVGIGKNIYSVSATGAVDSEDWNKEDPIKSCARRELKEELNFDIPESRIELFDIVAGVNKKQPIAILNATVDIDLSKGVAGAEKGIDYELEIQKIHVCKISDINKILREQQFTEAAEFHLKGLTK